MNLQELWSGTDYAYFPERRNKEVYRRYSEETNARSSYYKYMKVFRVKIIRTFQKEDDGKKRKTGYAEVLFCDIETGEPLFIKTSTGDDEHHIETIRAREIAVRWEEYWDEHEHHEVERELRRERERKAEEERRRHWEEVERQRREREEKERLAREERLRKEREEEEHKRVVIIRYLTGLGIAEEFITLERSWVYINRPALEERLGLNATSSVSE